MRTAHWAQAARFRVLAQLRVPARSPPPLRRTQGDPRIFTQQYQLLSYRVRGRLPADDLGAPLPDRSHDFSARNKGRFFD